MTTERFNVVLQGSTLRGQDVATVATELAKLIKRDTDFATHLLRGQPTKLKSGIDAATGARYIEALERIGVAVRLEPETLEVDADLPAPPGLAAKPVGVTAKAVETSSAPSVASTAAPTEVPMEAFYKAAIGPTNQPFYLNYFSKAERTDGFHLSWHWPAFFLTFPWLLYRKMFVAAILYVVVNFGVGFFIGYKTAVGGGSPPLVWFDISWVILAFLLPAPLANGIYYRHVRSQVAAAKAAHREPSNQLRDVTLAAGTSMPASVIGYACYFVATVVVLSVAQDIKHQAAAAQAQPAPTQMQSPPPQRAPVQAPLPTPVGTAAPSNPFADPDFGKTPVETRQPEPDPSDADAQFALGMRYDSGQGVPQDYAEAVKWYRKAADQGNASAQNSLGMMYANGLGVPQDFAEAVKWYRKAAVQGNTLAYGNLGIMYEYGRGVPQDHAEAMKWIGKAEAR